MFQQKAPDAAEYPARSLQLLGYSHVVLVNRFSGSHASRMVVLPRLLSCHLQRVNPPRPVLMTVMQLSLCHYLKHLPAPRAACHLKWILEVI